MKTRYKFRNTQGDHVAALGYAEDAAALAGLYGAGATINWQNLVTVWQEGQEAFSAGDSYSAAAEVMHARIDAYWAALDAARARRHNQPRHATDAADFDALRKQDRADTKAARMAAANIKSEEYAPT